MNEIDPVYVSDVDYLTGYVPELSPVHLTWAAAAGGYSPPSLAGEFRYVELGCGMGLSLVLHAACHPQARFYGVDINPRHIAFARTLAAEAGLTNVKFVERSFADHLADHLPDADIIAAHGVWSWVGPSNRQAIRHLVDRRLRPGGLFYVSYNALPGQALAGTVRRLMVEHAIGSSAESSVRARNALEFVTAIAAAKPRAFSHGDKVAKMLERLKQEPDAYLAHEYLNADWTPFYFADVSRSFAEVGLSFAGSGSLLRDEHVLMMQRDQRETLAGIEDPTRREQVKDYFVDEVFRRDVFVRAAHVGRPVDLLAAPDVRRRPIGTLREYEELDRNPAIPIGRAPLAEPVHDRLLTLLSTTAPTIEQLLADPELMRADRKQVSRALRFALATQVAKPFLDSTSPRRATEVSLPLELNRVLLDRMLDGADIQVLCAPKAGGAVALSPREAFVLSAIVTVGVDAAAMHAWDELRGRSRTLTVGGRKLEGAAEHVNTLREEVERFRTRKLGRLLRLGVVAPK